MHRARCSGGDACGFDADVIGWAGPRAQNHQQQRALRSQLLVQRDRVERVMERGRRNARGNGRIGHRDTAAVARRIMHDAAARARGMGSKAQRSGASAAGSRGLANGARGRGACRVTDRGGKCVAGAAGRCRVADCELGGTRTRVRLRSHVVPPAPWARPGITERVWDGCGVCLVRSFAVRCLGRRPSPPHAGQRHSVESGWKHSRVDSGVVRALGHRTAGDWPFGWFLTTAHKASNRRNRWCGKLASRLTAGAGAND